MKDSRFNVRAWTAAAVSAAFFVPLMVFGAPALANSVAAASQYEYSGSSQYQYRGKVTICHHTHSKKHPWVQIRVGASAAKAHLKHGDTLGACPPPAAPAPKKTGDDQHGKSGDHGKSGNHGKSGDHGNSGDQGSSGDQGKSGDHGNSGGNGHGKGKGK